MTEIGIALSNYGLPNFRNVSKKNNRQVTSFIDFLILSLSLEVKWNMERNGLGLPVFILCPVAQEWKQICKGSVLLVRNPFQTSNKTNITNFYKQFATLLRVVPAYTKCDVQLIKLLLMMD
jgi:hypothetical protein